METMLGFFNRPFLPLPLEEALDAILSTGTSHVGLLGKPGGGAYVEWNTPYSEIEDIHRQLDARGMRLHAVLARVHFDVDKDEAIRRYREFIDRAVASGAKHLLEMGAHKPETYDTYIEVMKAVSPYAHDRGVIIGIKPHGGISTSGEETADVVKRVGHPAFRAWYDPGNILYYKQLDPVAEARYFDGITVGVCVKDCIIGTDGKPSVSVTPGSGQVDFEAVFGILKEGGFSGGPCLIETLGPQDPEGAVQAGKLAIKYMSGVLERVGF
ncbi:MAG: sugar phosphate isomerase/epimerase [Anaerolineae bacterium]|nr:sugar phosphate isomerase/epimerase [Anaerolineae bacterium]